MTNETETLKILKWLSEAIITGITVAENINEWKCVKQKSYYTYHKSPEQGKELNWNLYLNLRRIDMEEKYFWGHKCFGTHAT